MYICSEVVYICNKDSIIFKDFCGHSWLVCKEEKNRGKKLAFPIFLKVAEFTRMIRKTKTHGSSMGEGRT